MNTRWWRKLVAIAALWFAAMITPVRARAAELPTHIADDAVHLGDDVQLVVPTVPASYVRVRRGPITIAYAPNLEAQVTNTLARVEADTRTLARQLGLAELPALEVRLVPNPDVMRELAPTNAPPPMYAVGVAYPRIGLTLVSSSAPFTHDAADMRRVLRHEMSHLLLEIATAHAAIPRWFSEGVAVHQAGEYSYERFTTLAVASFTRGIVAFNRLDAAFAGSGRQVEVAYAQSADFVSWLLRSGGEARFAVLLTHLREGMSLDAAFRQTYGRSLALVAADWKSDVDVRFITAPLWAGTGFLWLVGMALMLLAYRKRRKQSKATLDRWAREEEAMDRRAAMHIVPSITFVTPGVSMPSEVRPSRHDLN